jgi:Zn-dependent metalloprotease
MRNYLIVLTFLLHAITASSQRFQRSAVADTTITKSISPSGVILFKAEKNLLVKDLVTQKKGRLGLTANETLRLQKVETSQWGLDYHRYRQYYGGIEIMDADFIVEARHDTATAANGELFHLAKETSATPTLTKEAAIQSALAHCNARQYYWQNAAKEAKANAKGKSYYPDPDLCFFKTSDSTLELCYRMYVYAVQPTLALQYFVNAANGKIEGTRTMMYNCGTHDKKEPAAGNVYTELNCSISAVTTVRDGVKVLYAIYDDTKPGAPYECIDNCTPSELTVDNNDGYVYRSFRGSNWDLSFQNTSLPWDTRGAGIINWSLRACTEYFHGRFGRPGYGPNNAGSDLDAHYPTTFTRDDGSMYGHNAAYGYDPVGDDDLYFGVGAGKSVSDSYITPDIIAHEYQHGITQYRSNLVYEGESGALNESYSDIFGEAVERYIRGTCNFKLGDELTDTASDGTANNSRYRSLINPQDKDALVTKQPDRLFGTSWVNTADLSNDHGGVHTNSGVQNFMFYLLANGGSGYTNNATSHAANDQNIGFSYQVAGLGFDKAIAIAYGSQNLLPSDATFAQARNAWVRAAALLYGECSFEAIQTGKAWNAVGLKPPPANQEQVCTLVFADGFFYTLGSSAKTLESTTYMYVGKSCAAEVIPAGNLLMLKASGEVTFYEGFLAAEGTNLLANNEINECRFALY